MKVRSVAVMITLAFLSALLQAQGTRADYDRARNLRDKYEGLAYNIPERIHWIDSSNRFWYRKSVKGGNQFILVDATTLAKGPAFNHERLAAALSAVVSSGKYTAVTLPFQEFQFADNATAMTFSAAGSTWKCGLVEYSCNRTGAAPVTAPSGRRGGRGPALDQESPVEFENDVTDGMVELPPQEPPQQRTFAPPPGPQPVSVRTSPDGKYEALIQNFNLFHRSKDAVRASPLTFDGSEGNYYTLGSVAWSPDCTRIAAYRVRPGYRREVHYVETSPTDQIQPKHSTRQYVKPGDALDIAQPVLIDVQKRTQIDIDNSLFPNPYSLSNPVWRKDGRAFTFEYNQRGHQVYRVLEVDATSGAARALVTEESKTFLNYRPIVPNPRDTGKRFRHDLDDGKEFIWMSERDGWSHLYLYDGVTGRVKNQITKGEWVVRAIDHVEEEKREIWFQASGLYPGKDPYFIHYYKINFDGTGFTALTEADGSHTLAFSPDRKFYVDTWSRVDLPMAADLRRTEDRKVLTALERGNIEALLAAGWRPPETFKAIGRDGKTEIWGVLFRPSNFDAGKKYPVVEAIYAGPQGSFVPKTFAIAVQPLTELGFIVAQIDGMGTNNRSKAFHEVAWRNLGDGGLPDRILWHKAVAAKYPYYDITRVGVYGTSAGGQSATGALLFHPEFYKVGVSNSGCHDNRMDKIWWNEHWMGWPLGPHYAASSNVDNAHELKGKLLLVVPEMDTNVDPASTYQVVNALIKANKRFDFLVVPGANHGGGGAYYQRLLQDFFVHNLHGVEPPDWNNVL